MNAAERMHALAQVCNNCKGYERDRSRTTCNFCWISKWKHDAAKEMLEEHELENCDQPVTHITQIHVAKWGGGLT